MEPTASLWQADLVRPITARWERFLQLDAPFAAREDEGLERIFRAAFPVRAAGRRVEYLGYRLGRPKFPPDLCRDLELSWAGALSVRLRLVREDRDDGEEQEALVYLGHLPLMQPSGVFVVDGWELVVPLRRAAEEPWFPDQVLAEGLELAVGELVEAMRARLGMDREPPSEPCDACGLDEEDEEDEEDDDGDQEPPGAWLNPYSVTDTRSFQLALHRLFAGPDVEPLDQHNPLLAWVQVWSVGGVRGAARERLAANRILAGLIPLLDPDEPAVVERGAAAIAAALPIQAPRAPWVRTGLEPTVARGDAPATQGLDDGCLALGRDVPLAWADVPGVVVSEALVRSGDLSAVDLERSRADARELDPPVSSGDLSAARLERLLAAAQQPDPSAPAAAQPGAEDAARAADLDERGLVREGARVGPGDTLVRRTPAPWACSAEGAPLGRLERSLGLPVGPEGQVVAVRRYARHVMTPEGRDAVRQRIRELNAAWEAEHPGRCEALAAVLERAAGGPVRMRATGERVDGALLASYPPGELRDRLQPEHLEGCADPLGTYAALRPHLDAIEDLEHEHDRRRNEAQRGADLPHSVGARVVVEVRRLRPLRLGARLATRHGDVAEVTSVRPDAEMPTLPDGTRALVLWPLSASQGALAEASLGLAARAQGAPLRVGSLSQEELAALLPRRGGDEPGRGPAGWVHLLRTS